MVPVLRVELLTRSGCSLCDKARFLLDVIGEDLPLEVVAIDIDEDPELRCRYDQRIPVIRVAGEEVCEGVITLPSLRAAIGVPAR
jgi:hypothetical protein